MNAHKPTDQSTTLIPLSDSEMVAVEGGSWFSHLVHQIPFNLTVKLFPLGPMLGGGWSGGKFTFPRIQPVLE
jgi:hypothetical protein